MKNSNKKGFTLVELLVVIAILAILATVAVVGYTSFTDKAYESNDRSLVAQLNTAITKVDGKYETMHEVVEVLVENGFDATKIDATSKKHEILWNMAEQEFFYSADEALSGADIWIVADEVSTKYSTYYIGTETEITTSMGFDSGSCTTLNTITYKNDGDAQSVVINTNNEFAKLVIDAKNDEVTHYGKIGSLDVVAVKLGSYSEHGNVNGVATLTYGKINVKEGASISMIIAQPTSVDDVMLDVVSGGTVGVLISDNADVVEKLNSTGVQESEVLAAEEIEEVSSAVCYVKTSTGTTYYNTIQEAVDAAEGETTIVVLKNVQYDNVTGTAIKISAGKNIVLDLNGKVIEARLDNTKSVNLIQVTGSTSSEDVYAQLTIKDSSAGANGIGSGELRTTEAYNSDPMNVSASVISIARNGKVVIESGKIINENTNCAWGAYAIDVLTNTGAQNTWLTVNGGLVESATYRAIRAFCNSTEGTVYVTVNGGTVRSGANRAIWFQEAKENGSGLLTITGGTIEGASNAIVMGESDNITANITGGKFIQNGVDVTSTYVK